MYLAIMLIIVALLVFYNEIDSKMNIAEYMLLIIALIVIIGAAFNYINIDKLNEGFTSQIKNQNKNKNKQPMYKHDEDGEEEIMILRTEDSDVYLDSDEKQYKNNNSFTDYNSTIIPEEENKINNIHINKVNELLGISSHFTDLPIPTDYTNTDEIKSIFSPKVIIGKGGSNSNNDSDSDGNYDGNGFGSRGNSSNWNSAFTNDGFGFNNTMNPVNNLWRDNQSYYNDGTSTGSRNGGSRNGDSSGSCSGSGNSISNEQWSQNMDSYNKGKWQRNQYNRPSDYVDYKSPNSYGTNTPDSLNSTSTINGNTSSDSINNNNQNNTQLPSPNGETKKLCGAYTDLDENQSGDLIIKDYTQSKKWVAGYTYVPPIHWDVPQKHTPVCNSATPNVHKLTGLIDKGLPINALELTPDGYIADTEDTVKLSNVGSMIPKFNYQEQPFSKPYV